MSEFLTPQILAAAGLIALAGFFVLLSLFGDYRLGRHEVEVLLFDHVVRKISLYEIDQVLVGARFPGELWPARGMWRGHFLTIHRRRGLFRRFVICPRRPERLREHILYALGRNPHATQDGAAPATHKGRPEASAN